MNERTTPETPRDDERCRHPRRHRGLGAVTLLLVGGLAGAGIATAVGVAAHAGGGGYGMEGAPMMQMGEGMGMGMGHHGGGMRGEGRHGGGMHGEGMKDRVAWVLGAVDASPEQRDKVQSLLGDLRNQMRAMRGGHGDMRRQLITELAGADIDKAEVERIRAGHIAQMDAASRAMVEGMTAIAETLTPEQRQRIAEMMAMRGKRH